jgi:demethylmenaquinone methyltransferase/2-methoxy-6-polyprenyl-1,4-benzoquinol methylase
MKGYLRGYYAAIAPLWNVLVVLGSLGAFPRLYRLAANELRLRPGDTVIDVGCGTGLMLPYLTERVGPKGRVIGIDASEEMYAGARRRVQRAGWSNVDLHLSDASAFRPEKPVDAVLFSICLSCFESSDGVLLQAAQFLKPGGRLVVIDSFLNYGRWYFRLSNSYTRLKARIVGSKLNNRIRESAQAHLENPRLKILHGGLYTMISGVAPAARSVAQRRSG